MRTGAGLALIGVGAILAFAVTANPPYFNIHIAGWVLMLIGVIGLLVPRRTYGWLGRRMLVRRARSWPGNERVETVAVPPYAARNPGASRIEAGRPTTPGDTALGDTVAGNTVPADTEIVEDIYEQ